MPSLLIYFNTSSGELQSRWFASFFIVTISWSDRCFYKHIPEGLFGTFFVSLVSLFFPSFYSTCLFVFFLSYVLHKVWYIFLRYRIAIVSFFSSFQTLIAQIYSLYRCDVVLLFRHLFSVPPSRFGAWMEIIRLL